MRKTSIEWSKPGTNFKNIGLVLAVSAVLYAILTCIDAVLTLLFV